MKELTDFEKSRILGGGHWVILPNGTVIYVPDPDEDENAFNENFDNTRFIVF